jgi:SOS response regulatory protein OraA/RecX
MSCLTRKLQQKITRYVQKNGFRFSSNDPKYIREELVNKGICPSDVTTDQLWVILKEVKNS